MCGGEYKAPEKEEKRIVTNILFKGFRRRE